MFASIFKAKGHKLLFETTTNEIRAGWKAFIYIYYLEEVWISLPLEKSICPSPLRRPYVFLSFIN